MILLLEDDATIAAGIEYSLNQEGFAVKLAGTCKAATKIMESQAMELEFAILDLTLPDGSGYDICRRLKEKTDVPVIFLTACDEEVNVVMGLDMGADDYITKPFRVRELISRIKTILRRYEKSAGTSAGNKIQLQNVTVDLNMAKVFKSGREVELTALEYKLLLTFIHSRGQVLSRNQLLEGIWDVSGDFVNDNTLTVYIKRLRSKLEDESTSLIETVRGIGYRLL